MLKIQRKNIFYNRWYFFEALGKVLWKNLYQKEAEDFFLQVWKFWLRLICEFLVYNMYMFHALFIFTSKY